MRSRRLPLLTVLTLLATLLGLGALGAAPASAAGGSGSITTADGIIFGRGCYEHPFTYDVSLPPGTEYWSLNVSSFQPGGAQDDGDYVLSGDGVPTRGTRSTTICSTDPTGTWKLTADLRTCSLTSTGAYSDCTTVTLTPQTFVMRAARASVRLKPSTTNPRVGQRVRFVATVRYERPTGVVPGRFIDVELQRAAGSGFKRVARSYTDGRGKAVLRLRYTGGTPRLRAITRAQAPLDGATSPTVRLR